MQYESETQLPLLHENPALQDLPQVPQFLLSVIRYMHAPLQSVWSAEHDGRRGIAVVTRWKAGVVTVIAQLGRPVMVIVG
jgi:hypothetical protein